MLRQIRLLFLLLTSLHVVSFSQTSFHGLSKKYAQSQFKEGLTLLNKFQYNEALAFFESKSNISGLTNDDRDALLIFQAQAANMSGDSPKALSILRRISKQTKYLDILYNNIGRIHISLGNADSVYKYGNLIIKQNPNDSKGHALLKEYYHLNYQFDKALSHALKELKLAEAAKDTIEITAALYDVGTVWIGLNDYSKSLNFFEKSMALQKKQNITDNMFMAYLGLIDSYREMGEFKKSIQLTEEARQYLYTVPPHREGELILRKGVALTFSGDLKNGIIEYNKALPIFIKANKKALIANTYILMGRLQLELKDFANAEKNLLKGKEVAEQAKIAAMNESATDFLAELYETTGDYKKALFHLKRFKALEDSSFTIQKEGIVRDLSTKYETEKKEAANKLLLAEKNNAESRQKILIYTITFISLLFIAAVILLLRVQALSKRLKETNTKLEIARNMQNKLFTIISHDLRSPLSTYQRYSEIVGYLIRSKQYNRIEETLNEIDNVVLHMATLLDNLLKWSLLEQKHVGTNPKNINIKELFEGFLPIYRDMAKLKSIIIIEDIDNLQISTDGDSLAFIARNFVDNAVKYTEIGNEINISTILSDNELILRFMNISEALTDAQIKKIKMLFEDEKKMEIGETGLGVGLILIKQFADRIKAKITFDYTKEGLSIFELHIPLIIKHSVS